MKYLLPAALILVLLAGCGTLPENDVKYQQLAKVVDVHVYTDEERKEDQKALRTYRSGVGFGIGVGVGNVDGGFGGLMLGTGTGLDDRPDVFNSAPRPAFGATRYTVQPLHTNERIEVLSYKHYKVDDCVILFSGHPTEYARLFDPKPGEHCE